VRFRTPVFAVVATILSLALLALIAGNVYQFVHNRNAQVVATVNGAQITQRDFNRSDANSQQVLDQLISEKLIQQEAKRQKVTIPDSQINGQINTIKTQLGTEKDFQAALQRNNLTENQLRDQIRTQLLAEQLGAKGVTVSDSDAQTYYNQNKAQYGTQTFDQAKDSIKSTLLQQKQSDAIQTWVAGLRKNAKVVIRLPT
jgi:foldase protein PrsA